MNLSRLVPNLVKTVKCNSPEILTALGVSGVVSTAYLTIKATIRASEILEHKHQTGIALIPFRKEEIKPVWRCYIPAGISGAATIACIIGASKSSARRTAAAVTAYSITETAFSKYKEEVIAQVGTGKEQKIRDELAQKSVSETPPGSKELVIIGSGQVLCCELYTHRYFHSDMETLRKAQNDINERVVRDAYVPLDEFYELVGLPYTSASSVIGWDSNRQMELRFSTVMSESGVPCLAFEYNYVKPI